MLRLRRRVSLDPRLPAAPPRSGSRLLPVVLALGATQVIGYGTLYYAYAILAPAVAAEFDTSLTSLYAIFSAGLLAGGLAAPQLGAWMDRFGAPRIMAAGSLCTALLVGGLAIAPNLWAFAACVIAIEVVGVAVLYDAAFATLATLGRAEAKRAITHLTLIAGFASTIFWPLTGWLVEVLGWRGTYAAFAALHLLVALPLHAWISARPRGEALGGTGPEARQEFGLPLAGRAAQLAFWAVAVSFALSGVLTAAVTVHLVPVLQALELGTAAYLVAMLMGPAQVLIRLVDALFWRALHPLTVALVSAAALPAAILVLLLPVDPVAAGTVFAVLFGLGAGLSSIVRGSVPLALFGAAGYGARLGRLAAIRTVLGAGAPFLFAAGLEGFGPTTALAVALLVGIVALVPLGLLHCRVVPRRG
ncbi:MAG: MFS transporter [Roseomonas sp.]|jgi:MFS family permease|nr:MFS transporter [Roseomonas sp.]MCA3288855.1 MFS transporter [Roseomonas sp.]MCA3294927.1 MFS transporter [Roseomonas sp.]MCA4920630.1 MFS transporter [Roseomonas sp.]